jgi:two-component system, LytTR family, response regulator
MTIRVLIVDDEPLARARVRNILCEQPDLDIAEARNGVEAVEMILSRKPDVIFLDVQMPGLDGFGVVEAVGAAEMPITIFVTAFDEFAIRAFDAHALDYLLKPFDPERLQASLDRARGLLSLRAGDDLERKLTDLLGGIAPSHRLPERFAVRNGARITFVPAEQVDWVSAEGNYVGLHVGKATHLVRGTLGEFEKKLDPAEFLRIHRSTIVRIRNIQSVESMFRGEYAITLRDGTKLNSSGTYRGKIEQVLLGE